MPLSVAHVWQWFFDLSRTRQSGMGINPIMWQEIAAYAALNGIAMQRWELQMLAVFDAVFLDVMQNEQSEVKNSF